LNKKGGRRPPPTYLPTKGGGGGGWNMGGPFHFNEKGYSLRGGEGR